MPVVRVHNAARVHSAHCEIPSNNVNKISILCLDSRYTFYWPIHVNLNVFLSKYHCSSSATSFIIQPTAIIIHYIYVCCDDVPVPVVVFASDIFVYN